MRLRGLPRLRAATGKHQDDRLAGCAAASDGGEEFARTADLLGVEHQHAGRGIGGEVFDEIGQFESDLIAGGNDIR